MHELFRPLEHWDHGFEPPPLETRMFVCVYYVFVLSCVYVAALWRADPPPKESYRLCMIKKLYEQRPRIFMDCSAHRDRDKYIRADQYFPNINEF
jgi:hypothetical protein